MALMNSQASIAPDSDGQNDSVDNVSVISSPEAAVIVNVGNKPAERQPRWTIFRRGERTGAPANDVKKGKVLSITCRCKGAVKGSCLIACSSIVELIGNLLALVYGIAFIQSACNFYEAETDPEKRAKEYDEKLDRVLFLENNRVGFVGLLATCFVGVIVAFLMPVGTVYRSWKSLRAAMSLLFSMCLAHILLASIYLSDNELMASLVVVPFRIYEILLIYSHIKAYKKKKQEDAMRSSGGNRGSGSAIGSRQNLLGAASLLEPQSLVVATQSEKPLTSNVQVTFGLSGDNINIAAIQTGDDSLEFDKLRSKEYKSSKKRKIVQQPRQGERKNRLQQQFIIQDNTDNIQYK